MMGRQTVDQRQLFYLFNLEDRVPEHHLLRRINPTLTQILGDLRDKLEPFYSEIGRPSVDPELMIRCILPIAGSADSTSTTGFPITRHSRSIGMAASARATSSGKYSRVWFGRAWTRVLSRAKGSRSTPA